MQGEDRLSILLSQLRPELQLGVYVFATCKEPLSLQESEVVGFFREKEGYTYIVAKETADRLSLVYHFEAAWIVLTVHSALEAVGLTAAFSTALARAGIACNVVAGYYHDHLFVGLQDAKRAMEILTNLSKSYG